VLTLLDTAVYDSEALVLLPAADADASAATAAGGASQAAAGVLGEVSAALRPLGSFFGRQHLQALLALAGPAGQAHLLEGLMDKLDEEQVGNSYSSGSSSSTHLKCIQHVVTRNG
jgi:hypothetical protein